MKALTTQKRNILFGMMVLSLGMTKSWLQTADNNGVRSFASESQTSATAPGQGAPAPTGRSGTSPQASSTTVKSDKNKIATCDNDVIQVTHFHTSIVEVPVPGRNSNNEIVILKQPRNVTYANYIYDCKSDNISVEGQIEVKLNESDLDNQNFLQNYEKLFVDDVNKKVADIKKAKKAEEDRKSCRNKFDKMADKYNCLANKIKEESGEDRDKLRDAFDSQIVDQLIDALQQAETAEERREILESLNSIKSAFGGERALSVQMRWLEKGVKAFASNKKNENILMLGYDSYRNPNNRTMNDQLIDRIAWQFNTKTNPALMNATGNNRAVYDKWSDLIVPVAVNAQRVENLIQANNLKSEEVMERLLDSSSSSSSTPNDGITGIDRDSGSRRSNIDMCDSRRQRCDTGFDEIPSILRNSRTYRGDDRDYDDDGYVRNRNIGNSRRNLGGGSRSASSRSIDTRFDGSSTGREFYNPYNTRSTSRYGQTNQFRNGGRSIPRSSIRG